MSKHIAVIFSALLVLFLLSHPPACAQDQIPKFNVRVDLAPEYRMFIPEQLKLEDIHNFGISADAQGNNNKNNNQKKSRLGVSVSRLVVGSEKVDPFEDDKISKWGMLRSLPGDFANAPTYQDRLEIVGKIFEPKITLDIEF